MAKIKTTDNIKYCQECEATGILTYYWWEYKLAQPLWKIDWHYLLKLKLQVPLTLPPSNFTPRYTNTHRNGCTRLPKYMHRKIYSHSVHHNQRLSTTTCPQRVEWINIICFCIFMQWRPTQQWKRMDNWYLQQQGWASQMTEWKKPGTWSTFCTLRFITSLWAGKTSQCF